MDHKTGYANSFKNVARGWGVRRSRAAWMGRGRALCLALLAAALPAPLSTLGPAAAQQEGNSAASIERTLQALGQRVDGVLIRDVPIGEALAAIEKKTGVPIHMSDFAYGLIPLGRALKFNEVSLRNVTLQDGLLGMVAPLGMTIEVVGGGIEVAPKPALLRIGRRASWDEIGTLHELSRLKGGAPKTVQSIMERAQFDGVGGEDAKNMLGSELRAALNQNGAAEQLLDEYCANYELTWYPQDRFLVFSPATRRFEQLLERNVAIDVVNLPLVEVLHVISGQCGVPIQLNEQDMSRIPAPVLESVSLRIDGYSASHALAALCRESPLTYNLSPEGVRIFASNDSVASPMNSAPTRLIAQKPETPDAANPDPVLGLIPIPLDENGDVIFMVVRKSEISTEVWDFLQQRKKGVLDKATADMLQSLKVNP